MVKALSGTFTDLVGESTEMRISNAWCPVDRKGQHVGTIVENLLCAVAMMIINVENSDPSMMAQLLDRNGRVVQIAESPKTTVSPRDALADDTAHR